jgi:hypothetical protein
MFGESSPFLEMVLRRRRRGHATGGASLSQEGTKGRRDEGCIAAKKKERYETCDMRHAPGESVAIAVVSAGASWSECICQC